MGDHNHYVGRFPSALKPTPDVMVLVYSSSDHLVLVNGYV